MQTGLLIEFPAGDIVGVPTKQEWQDWQKTNAERLKAIEVAIGLRPKGDDSSSNWISSHKGWFPIGAPLVALLAVMLTGGIHLDNKIDAGQKTVEAAVTRLQKVEDAVKLLGSQQSDATQKLIHDLLAAAKNTNDHTIADRAIQVAASLTTTLKQRQQPAPSDFFRDSIQILNATSVNHTTPQTATEVLKTRVALAEYRSALESIPNGGSGLHFGKRGGRPALVVTGNNGFDGVNFLIDDEASSAIQLGPQLKGKLSEGIFFANGVIKGGTQTLDGITWRNAVFVNTHIHYDGGELSLQNVTFVNCTFDVPPTKKGADLLDYAALAAPRLTIG